MNHDHIRQLFNDKIFSFHGTDSRRCDILLKEPTSTTLKQVQLVDMPGGSILFKMDNIPQPKDLFNSQGGKCRRCDYLLIVNNYAIYMELKSGNKDAYEQQFKGAEAIIDYAESIMFRFHNVPNLFKELNRRYVRFYYDRYAKSTPDLKKTNDNYDNIREIPVHESGSMVPMKFLV